MDTNTDPTDTAAGDSTTSDTYVYQTAHSVADWWAQHNPDPSLERMFLENGEWMDRAVLQLDGMLGTPPGTNGMTQAAWDHNSLSDPALLADLDVVRAETVKRNTPAVQAIPQSTFDPAPAATSDAPAPSAPIVHGEHVNDPPPVAEEPIPHPYKNAILEAVTAIEKDFAAAGHWAFEHLRRIAHGTFTA